MTLFRQLHKSAFWSQLLLSMLAVLALPTSQPSLNEVDLPAVAKSQNTDWSELSLIQKVETEQAHLLLPQEISTSEALQAVVFYDFFANLQETDLLIISPIRAGPFNII